MRIVGKRLGGGRLGIFAWCVVSPLLLVALAHGQPRAEATRIHFENQEEGAELSLEGRIPRVPPGTCLYVRAQVREAGSHREIAFFMRRLESEHFRIRKLFRYQRLAPREYWVRLELTLSAQPPEIASLLMKEWGLCRDANVVLTSRHFRLGTLEEEAALHIATLGHLVWFSRVAKEMVALARSKVTPPEASDAKAWNAIRRSLGEEVRGRFTRPFEWRVRSFVALHEAQAVGQLRTIMNGLGPALKDYGRGKASRGSARLSRIEAQIQVLEADLLRKVPESVSLRVEAPSKLGPADPNLTQPPVHRVDPDPPPLPEALDFTQPEPASGRWAVPSLALFLVLGMGFMRRGARGRGESA